MQARTRWTLAAGVGVAIALLAWAFLPRPAEVELALAAEGRFEATIDEDGKTRLADRYVVSAPLAGRLSRIKLREGDAVQAGSEVAVLSPLLSPMLDERTRREQQARVAASQAQLARAGARIGRARVAVEHASLQLRRSEQLARSGFVAPTQLDSDRLEKAAAEQELHAAVQERHMATHELEEARAALAALRPGRSGAQFPVRSPVAGQVLRVHQASESSVAQGTPLMDIGDLQRLEVVVELLTTDALRARPGTPVRIERWGGPAPLEGKVKRVEPAAFTKVSALGVEEQRVNTWIEILSPHSQWRQLGDGFRVWTRIVVLAADRALQVPSSAVFPLAGAPSGGEPQHAVFVADGGRAKQVSVTVGGRNGSHTWITQGLRTNDRVIVYPPATLSDGARVRERTVR